MWSLGREIRHHRRNGAPDRNRTCDAGLRKPALYPLSYWGNNRFVIGGVVGSSDMKLTLKGGLAGASIWRNPTLGASHLI